MKMILLQVYTDYKFMQVWVLSVPSDISRGYPPHLIAALYMSERRPQHLNSASPSKKEPISFSSSLFSSNSISSFVNSFAMLRNRSRSKSSNAKRDEQKAYTRLGHGDEAWPKAPPPLYHPSPYAGQAEVLDDDNMAWGKPSKKNRSRR